MGYLPSIGWYIVIGYLPSGKIQGFFRMVDCNELPAQMVIL